MRAFVILTTLQVVIGLIESGLRICVCDFLFYFYCVLLLLYCFFKNFVLQNTVPRNERTTRLHNDKRMEQKWFARSNREIHRQIYAYRLRQQQQKASSPSKAPPKICVLRNQLGRHVQENKNQISGLTKGYVLPAPVRSNGPLFYVGVPSAPRYWARVSRHVFVCSFENMFTA